MFLLELLPYCPSSQNTCERSNLQSICSSHSRLHSHRSEPPEWDYPSSLWNVAALCIKVWTGWWTSDRCPQEGPKVQNKYYTFVNAELEPHCFWNSGPLGTVLTPITLVWTLTPKLSLAEPKNTQNSTTVWAVNVNQLILMWGNVVLNQQQSWVSLEQNLLMYVDSIDTSLLKLVYQLRAAFLPFRIW